MIRESTADVIRRRRGMKPMDEVNDGLQRPAEEPPRVLEVPPEFQAQEQATAEPQQQVRDPDLEAAAAEAEKPRPGSIPGQMAQSVMGAMPPRDTRDEDELYAAQEADRKSRFSAGMELAGRQLVGGITRTPVGQSLGAAPSQVPGAISAAKSRSERAAEVLRLKRQGTQDERQSKIDATDEELKRARIADLLRAKQGKGDPEGAAAEIASYKAVMTERYPEAAKLIAGSSTMKVLQDLQNSLDAQRGQDKTLEGQKELANASRGEARRVREEAKAEGKPLTDSTLMELSDTDSAIASLDGLGKKFVALGQEGLAAKASGKASALLGLTSTDAGQFQASAKLAMQGVGKIMEGGKLAAGDEVKYAAMLPVSGDSYESAAIKIKDAQAYLRKLRDDRVKVLRAAGRNVPDMGDKAPEAPAAPIRVKNKATGQTGTIPANKFNPDKYDKVQ